VIAAGWGFRGLGRRPADMAAGQGRAAGAVSRLQLYRDRIGRIARILAALPI
jgi:hypothetical protein